MTSKTSFSRQNPQDSENDKQKKKILEKLKEMQILTDFVLGNTQDEKEKLDILKQQLNGVLTVLDKESDRKKFDFNVDTALKLIETIYVTVGNFEEIKDRMLPLLSLRNKLDSQ